MKPVFDKIRNNTSSVAYYDGSDYFMSRARADVLRMVDQVFDVLFSPRFLVHRQFGDFVSPIVIDSTSDTER